MPPSKKKIGIIVQARMGSTRLPEKIMKQILGKPMLSYGIERLKKVNLAQNIIIATVDDKANDPIVSIVSQLGVDVFRGSEDDVLSRYYEAAKKFKLDVVVRVTSDCPVIDPAIVDEIIKYFLDHQPIDYVSNTLVRTFPRGMDTEVFSFEILSQAYQKAREPYQREHVTPYMIEQGKTENYVQSKNESQYRLTVDTPEDFELIKRIFEVLYKKGKVFTLKEIVELLKKDSSLMALNAHVEQKGLK